MYINVTFAEDKVGDATSDMADAVENLKKVMEVIEGGDDACNSTTPGT